MRKRRVVSCFLFASFGCCLFLSRLHAQETKGTPVVNPMNVNFNPGPEYGPDERKYQGITSIERSPGGRLWAFWYAGKVWEDRYNYICCVTSGDDGRTWSDLKFVIDPDGDGPLRTADPCPWLDPDGRLWLFWWLNGGGKSQLNAMITDNPDAENPTWTEPRMICPGVMMCKPIVAADGTWLLPTAIWHRDESCRVVASVDKGRTWELRGAAGVPDPKDRNCDEPMMVQRRDGSLWMLVRTQYGIGETSSTDMGRTWTPVKPSGIPHPASRFFIRRLLSGNLLLVKHGPMDKRTGRSHLTAYVSKDDGLNWEGGLLLDERGDVSYPDGTQSPDGIVRVIYDWRRADEKHILMAAFTEEDVLAGKEVSGKVRKRVLINQATGFNPKPWLKDGRFIGLKKNEDGTPLLTGPGAELQPLEGELRKTELGQMIFGNRSYRFHEQLPDVLRGNTFLFGSIDRIEAACTAPGIVYVLTPTPERNSDTLTEALEKLGFAKAAVPEFVLFLDNAGNVSGANSVTVYQKKMSAGDKLSLGKWGVVVLPGK